MAVNSIQNMNTMMPLASKAAKVSQDNIAISFTDFFSQALDKVNELQKQSQQQTEDFAVGKTDNIHQVLIAAEKADVALQMTLQIRNKILDAYNEIMRMPM